MTKYYGIGQERNYKWLFAILLGNKMLQIAFWTKKYKFLPRIYWYSNCGWGEQKILKLKWVLAVGIDIT